MAKDHDKLFSRAILMLRILRAEGSKSIKELAEEFGVSERTIHRDIERLHFFPIELRRGVVYLDTLYDIENPTLPQDELLIAELALSSISGIDERLDKTIQTIRAKLSYPLFFTPYRIKSDGYEAIDMDSELLNKIEDAITKRNYARFISHEQEYIVEPYKVVAFDGIWYLFARDTDDKKLKTYFISEIKEFRASAKNYTLEYKDIDKVLENVHTAWFEDGNSFEVKVKIKQEIAKYFQLKQHLPSQKIVQHNKDGSIVVTFKVSCDDEVDNLIKAWLPHIEVITPERFRRKILSELEGYVKSLRQQHHL